ncbi:MAG: outer membrane beta-barrel protein [Gammaproteobacteria bacterium]|nr:outer membrane beta-barrel protein [Gammaproteobacteria bacterium]
MLRSLLLLVGLLPLWVLAVEDDLRVQITAPYVEMHTGPGSGYPIDYVVERGEWVSILKRRTDWFKVRTRKGKQGWVFLDQMQQSRLSDGTVLHIESLSAQSFQERDWEMGFHGGEMDGAALLNLYAGYAFSPNLSAELSLTQALGNFSSEYLLDLNLLSEPFPEWRFSPFFTLGGGMIHTSPNATLVQTEDRTDSTAHVGLGLRVYLTRRFYVRGEFRHYTVFTSRNENEEFNQWKLGIGTFF